MDVVLCMKDVVLDSECSAAVGDGRRIKWLADQVKALLFVTEPVLEDGVQ